MHAFLNKFVLFVAATPQENGFASDDFYLEITTNCDVQTSEPCNFCHVGSVTMSNSRNIRISDGYVCALIRKGLGMHLVTYMNCDTVPFLL